MTYENPWIFNGQPFSDSDIGESYGFVYLITCLVDGRRYIGRKYFYSKRKPRKGGRRRTSESDWKTYYGSSDELLDLVERHGTSNFKREIISLHKTAGDTNICEVAEQFRRGVLEDATYLNANINGKWRRQPDHIVNARRRSTTV